jgi:hypothetical protein
VLPDPLVMENGKTVRDAKTWFGERRPEILGMFEREIYGKAPPRPRDESFDVFESSSDAMGGQAIRKQVDIHLSADAKGPKIQMLMYLPAHASGKVPVFLCFSFFPLQLVSDDPAIRMQDQARGGAAGEFAVVSYFRGAGTRLRNCHYLLFGD